VEAGLGHANPFGIDIALAVTDNGDHRGGFQDRLGSFGAAQPAGRFPLAEPPVAMRFADPAGPCPDFPGDRTEAGATAGVHRNHAVRQHAMDIALLDKPEPSAAAGRGFEPPFRRGLDRQPVPAGHRRSRSVRPPPNDPVDCHPAAGEKAAIAQNPTARDAQPPHAHRRACHHTDEEGGPRPIEANIAKVPEAAIHSGPPSIRTAIYRFIDSAAWESPFSAGALSSLTSHAPETRPSHRNSLTRIEKIRARTRASGGEGKGYGMDTFLERQVCFPLPSWPPPGTGRRRA